MLNQSKIEAFISGCRKAKGLTQSQLAEKLGITDKAVSKWKTGKAMPDLSLFTQLCELLGITLNELFLGEFISDDNLKEKSNQVLFDVIASWLGKDKWEMENMAEAPVVLSLKNVKKVYDSEKISTVAVKNISFEVAKGSFTTI